MSRGENEISRLLVHLKKFFGCPWKNPLLPPPLEKSFQRPCRFRWLQKVGPPETLAEALLLVLLSVSDYKRVYASLYFITTNFNTELKPQVKVSHGMNSPAFTLYATFDKSSSVSNHTALIRFD